LPKNKKCQFRSNIIEGYSCPEPPLKNSNYCIFHKPHKTQQEEQLFEDKIDKKLQNKDYDFTGYHFLYLPSGLPGQLVGQVFEDDTHFIEATFEGDIELWELTFKGKADFRGSTFQGKTDFRGSTFEGETDFRGSTFEEYVVFYKSTFKERSDFRGSTFEEYIGLSGTTFEKRVLFSQTSFEFEETTNFTEIIFRSPFAAEYAFRVAKIACQRQGDYALAGEHYYREKIAIRKQLPLYHPKRWFEYLLLDGLCGYGERPLRAVRTGLGVLFGLALLYWRVGHIYPSPELFNEPHALTFWDALYFSVVTFTTLGFGDWRPDPSHWIRYVVMSEAFIGAFLMALFIVTFARRMMR